VYDYVQKLIQLRKAHPSFRMTSTAQIKNNLQFFKTEPGLIGYQLNGAAVKDHWKKIQVWFNGSAAEKIIPAEQTRGFKTVIANNVFVTTGKTEELIIKPYSCVLLYKQ